MKYKNFLALMLIVCSISSCTKYLDAVPDKSLTVPSSLQDLAAILNNNLLIAYSPALGEIGSDDYYMAYSRYQTYRPLIREAYTWQKDITYGSLYGDWYSPYQAIYYSNVVLDQLKDIGSNQGNQGTYNEIKGRALFYRAFSYYNLAQIFTKPYDPQTAATDLGLPLRLSSDINNKTVRSTLLQTYNQIIQDLQEAEDLLPLTVSSQTPYIPSKAADDAMQARVYLTMQNYDKALDYADSSISLNNTLMDYNAIDSTQAISFPYPSNEEVLFQSYEALYFYFTGSYTIVDSTLYDSYSSNDLRKSLFFATKASTGTHYFKGSYSGTYDLFCGLATDEMYLIQAECYARDGKVTASMDALNTLLAKRWKAGTFAPLVAANADEAMSIVLAERRKELIFRGIRWSDLRRLNQDSRFAITLTRVLNGETYTLPPNDPRYVYPIPDNEIQLSGIQQNTR
ncbi:MAG: RagB/SusD family nutrient uptake outer membrane protein [Chitinophagaceae bacterium]|nr:MAG: RagB/SusD family nutrient uptake outer membrane protein [Chitinophagaceae bacterium]